MCDNPAPQFGGLDCTHDGSSDTETEDCNTQECPSKLNIPLLTIAPKDFHLVSYEKMFKFSYGIKKAND